ncbi:hypothetical protein [Streptomyces sp. IB2014 016-6]|uniref:hypothetical protein n=1 Tax=Streptomyces sp. IB2014 016-6 TaxID=2517818 RepID=UPI0011CC6E27|nr:hypothetical protein [Streptomyces sp. IB2014 016-6]TXL86648.1 hypothetical protein EW053_26005 [Streptomyces sp. IB2014 016-6]
MLVEPRFRDQIRCLVLKDRRAKALDEALSPGDRIAFNGFLASVVAVLLAPRLGDRCGVEDLAAFSHEVAARHRSERRPVNEFVVEEILRLIYGVTPLFQTIPVPPMAVSSAGAAIVRYLNNTDAGIAAEIERVLDTAVDLHQRRTPH